MESDERYENTSLALKVTRDEEHYLWQLYHSRTDWKSDSSGWNKTIGTFEGMPVCVSIRWATINSIRVVFYYGCSQVVNEPLIDCKMKELCPNARCVEFNNFYKEFDGLEPAPIPREVYFLTKDLGVFGRVAGVIEATPHEREMVFARHHQLEFTLIPNAVEVEVGQGTFRCVFVTVRGHTIVFYYPTSDVVDWGLIQPWLKARVPTTTPFTDACNAHVVLNDFK